MSETGMGGATAGTSGSVRNRLYDTAGKPLGGSSQSGSDQTEQVAAFMRDEPLASVLIALIVGYLLGKIV